MIDQLKKTLKKHSYMFLPLTVILLIAVALLVLSPEGRDSSRHKQGADPVRAGVAKTPAGREYFTRKGLYYGEHLIVPVKDLPDASFESDRAGDQVSFPVEGGWVTVSTGVASTETTMADRRARAGADHVESYRRGFVASMRRQNTSNVQLVDQRGVVVITVQVATTQPRKQAVRIAEQTYERLRVRR